MAKPRIVSLIIFVIFLSGLVLGACASQGSANRIVGHWETEVQGVFVVYEFTDGGELILHLPDGSSQSVGTYEVDGDELILMVEGEKATTTLEFSNNNTLKMIDSDAEYLYTRVE
jgi:uncharacterized protein (TIGR03066 family)